MTTVNGRWQKAARLVTELSTPAAVNTVIPLIIGAHVGSAPWGFIVSLCSGIIPMAYIAGGIRVSRISDHHVTERAQRPAVMAFILGTLLVGLLAEVLLSAPADVVALTCAMVATLLALAVVTVVVHWKISVHTAVAAGSVVMLATALGGAWLLLLVLVPVVMWSRVELDDHSPSQVLAGAVLGAALAGAAFALLR